MFIIPVITYGSPTWSATQGLLNEIGTTKNFMMRSILDLEIKDKVKLKNIWKTLPNIKKCIQIIRDQKWGWAGQVARMQSNRRAHIVTFWSLEHKTRNPG